MRYLLLVAAALAACPAMAGDVDRGREVFVNRELGHCVLCHEVAQLDVPFQGNLGPPLTTIADRFSPTEIREKIIDPTRSNPDTSMPAYYRTDGLSQVARAYVRQTVLNEVQLEDLLAYLATLQR